MDKYEMRTNIEDIKELVKKKKYKQASDIALTLNWHKVKDWEALSAAITAHENVGELEEARDMAILAYNRNLGGKRLVYELTTLMTKLQQFEEANQLFREYERMAPKDADRYVLYYELRTAEKAPITERIEILEDYRDTNSLDEKYIFELAKIYANAGMEKECISTCNEIALLFQDGPYVVKALKLKRKKGAPLTEVQEATLAKERARRTDVDATKEMLFQQQMNPERFSDDKEAELEEMLDGEKAVTRDTRDLGAMIDEAQKQAEFDDEVDYTEFETEYDENGVNRKLKRFILAKVAEAEDAKKSGSDKQADGYSAVDETAGQETEGTAALADNADSAEAFTPEMFADDEAAAAAESEQAAQNYSETQEETVSHEEEPKIGQMPESLKDLIANAKKKIESHYDEITKESEKERLEQERREAEEHIRAREDAMEIGEVAVPGDNIYDTQNLQAEIARNMSAVLDDDDMAQDVSMFRPNPAQETLPEEADDEKTDEQIEGQMSIADWIETVREEKYGSQDTKEYSKSELNRILDQKEENSAAYERILKEKKNNKKSTVSKGDTQEMLIEAKTDLAIRTGKASQKLEEAVEILKEAAAVAGELSDAAEDGSGIAGGAQDNDIASDVAAAVQRELTASVENVSLDTARLDTVPDEVLAEYVEREMSTEKSAKRPFSGGSTGTVHAGTRVSGEGSEFHAAAAKKVSSAAPVKKVAEYRLDANLSRYFKKYKEMPGLESQIAEFFNALPKEMKDNTSSTGNILISGNSSSDKYDLARSIVRGINALYPDNPKKIAKTSGDSINHRGIAKSMAKLRGTVLVIEGAGVIQPKRMQELLSCMEQDTGRMIVILEDSDEAINVLLQFNPDMSKKFNHRMILKQYTVNELVEAARKYAQRRSYEVGDDALLELYLRIDKMHSEVDSVRVNDVKEVINQAIENSEKRASRKFFKGIKKKHTENGDLIYLTEADFKG